MNLLTPYAFIFPFVYITLNSKQIGPKPHDFSDKKLVFVLV